MKAKNEYADDDKYRLLMRRVGGTAEPPPSSPETTATGRGGRARPSKTPDKHPGTYTDKHTDKHPGSSPDKGTGKHTDKSPDIYPDKHPGILPAKSEAGLEAWELDGIQRRSARFDLLWAPGTRDAIQAAAKAAKISTNEAINQILIHFLRERAGAK